VSFHYSGPFSNVEAQQRWSFYSLSEAPSNVYDGHYGFTGSINEDAINSSGTRQVHMLEISLSKSVDDATLSFSGSVRNLDTGSFNGFILVFITESGLVDPFWVGVSWNFVFRGYGLNKTISLASLATDTFSGSWSIPAGVESSHILVVAAVYDTSTVDTFTGCPFSVQSVCDVCEQSTAIPEYPTIWMALLSALEASTALIIVAKKRMVGRPKDLKTS